MRPQRPFIETSAAEWGLPLRAARSIFWLPIVVTTAFLAVPLVYPRLGSDAQWIVRRALLYAMEEDGPVEWTQVFCFVAGGIAAAVLARRLLRSNRARGGLVFAAASLALVVIAGEEISWGQRIAGVATPDWLADVNDQDELNAHNIAGVKGFLDYPRMLVGAWGVLGGLLASWLAGRASLQRVGLTALPPFFLAPSFGVMLGYDVLRATVWDPPGFFLEMVRYGEWPELSLAFGLCAFLVLSCRRMSRADQEVLSLELEAQRRRIDPAA